MESPKFGQLTAHQN